MPMPVPLLDIPHNLDRLLRSSADDIRGRLTALVAALGRAEAQRAVQLRPAEAALTRGRRLEKRVRAAEAALGCGKVGQGEKGGCCWQESGGFARSVVVKHDAATNTLTHPTTLIQPTRIQKNKQLDAFLTAVALRNHPAFSDLLAAAGRLAADLSVPPLELLPLFTAYGAAAPAEVAAATADRYRALRGQLPAAAPGDLVALLRMTSSRRRAAGPTALVASLSAASQVLGLTPYRVLQLVIRDAGFGGTGSSSNRARRHGGPPSGGSSGAADGVSLLPSPSPAAMSLSPARGTAVGRRRPQYMFLLMPAERLRARADVLGQLLGVSGPQLESLLRNTPRLLAHDSAQVARRMEYLAGFLTGVDGGGAGGAGLMGTGAAGLSGGGTIGSGMDGGALQPMAADERLRDAAWQAAQSALRRCPKLLQLDVSTCVERVRAVESALRLQGAVAWGLALRAPEIMAHSKERLAAAAGRLEALAGGLPEARAVVLQEPSTLVQLSVLRRNEGRAAAARAAAAAEEEEEDEEEEGFELEGSEDEDAEDEERAGPRRGGANPKKRARGAAGRPAAASGARERLEWMAASLGVSPEAALSRAVTNPSGRRLLWDLTSQQAVARVERLGELMGLSPGEVVEAAVGKGFTGYR
jgi:hypothetical protein